MRFPSDHAAETTRSHHHPPQISTLGVSVQSHFRVEVLNEGRASVISVSGELDLASSAALDEALTRATESDAEQLVLDLRELEFMDSTGLSTLVKAHQRAEEAGKQFGLVRGPQQVQRLLSLTGVEERLRFGDTPGELIDSH
jgi:anti-sigma B factor antagonist